MTQQYQVLARKYRPKNFHELIGQTHVSQALINAIDYNRLHHAYLFTGTRGVGKTTIARILSKCLNCDTGVTSTPCGVCDNCVAIDQGRFIDLIEIDAASRTKVEDTRELLDNVPYAPSQGRYKVYLIDEVHMLSTHSFNALLKTLEEPPEHVKFLLATTDPQKLPITIISRCLQFVLRPLPQTLLSEHLANLLTLEHVDYTQPALWQLASAAKGSVRDALSLTDQAIAFGKGALDDVTVNEMLGLIDAADLVRLITDIYNHDKSAVAAHIEQMRAQMVDASSMFDGLAELLHQLALTQLLPEVALNVNEAQAETINTLAQHISPDVLQLYYEIVVQAREGIKLASTPMQALEMCILRLLAFRPLPVDEIVAYQANQDSRAINNNVVNGDANTGAVTNNATATINASEQVNSIAELQVYDIDHQNIDYQNPDTLIIDGSVVDNIVSDYSVVDDYQHSSINQALAADNANNLMSSPLEEGSVLKDRYADEDSYFLAENAAKHLQQSAAIVDKAMVNTEIASESTVDTDTAVNNRHSTDGLNHSIYNMDSVASNSLELEPAVQSEPTIEPSVVAEFELVTESITAAKPTLAPTATSRLAVAAEAIIVDKSFINPKLVANAEVDSKPTDTSVELSPNDSHGAISINDPRILLRCATQSLTGEWNAEKWDYWLQSAREQNSLAEDERALARQGMMTGLCNGKATFITTVDSKHLQATFEQLAAKLQQQFSQADISLRIDNSLNEVKDKTPESRQQLRLEQASLAAQELLLQSPVMQHLLERQQGKMGKVKLT
ncbi:DNA polymerase III subunit gamma/tau [Psychrobacter sp. TAE2020]|uniref:DNA polymerase III subunit gamma/tau n=1 Tax=Psychrobacter sp. TAE2020 TaxID=2846762 RepID=UPI001C102077|nr:DNA polymerase III subunit gamma/tau [Psychrobacter sp. TAE2020]MBU5615617.1 DNA polymerase III subunit gamma/tau [Psychrobacter sp. TAE2020]